MGRWSCCASGDLLAEYVLAMKHGLGMNKVPGTIHTYPTLSGANKYAAGERKRAYQPLRLFEWVGECHDCKRTKTHDEPTPAPALVG